ncbi:Bestrophin [Dirofilaria immitis]
MTISYTGNLCRLLIRWKGSLWRSVWKELLIFLILYYAIRFFYNHLLPLIDEENPEKYRYEFEQIAITFDQYTKMIPLTFLLGFYVSNVVIRWWRQFECIPWPEDLLSLLCTFMSGKDITSQQRRHTIARYINLVAALVYREISSSIRRRFPSMIHLVESGLLTDTELKLLNETSKKIRNIRWMVPLHWVQQIVVDEVNDNAPSPALVNNFMQELKAYRTAFRKLFSYDWVCVPLVYTQVAALATYAHFAFCLISRQYLDPSKKYHNYEVDLIVPIFTIVQFLFFVGWYKVGQDLMRPFGMDDDDFELDYIFERNVSVSFAIVDQLQMNDYEPLQKDKFWITDDSGTISIPRTGLANRHKQRKPIRHIPSYKPVGYRDIEEGKTRCNMWRKKWHGYDIISW